MNVYVLTDGLSEDPKVLTSLDRSAHPNLDHMFTGGHSFLFEPVRVFNMLHPATYFIFPYFLGLSPDLNPGRAAFELIENGVDIGSFHSFAVFRIITKTYDVRKGWYEKTESLSLELVEPIIHKVAHETYLGRARSAIVKSKLSHNIWCVGSETEDSLEFIINALQYELSQYDLNVYPTLFSNGSHHGRVVIDDTIEKTVLGWLVGPTAEAFRMLGFSIGEQKCHTPDYVFNFNAKIDDFQNRILPHIKLMAASEKNADCILYIKETSSAAKKNMPQKKIEAIEFVDTIIGMLLNAFTGKTVNIIVISDHQSNIGVPYVFPGPSLVCVYNTGHVIENGVSNRMTEKNIACQVGSILSQEDCVKEVNMLINKTHNG